MATYSVQSSTLTPKMIADAVAAAHRRGKLGVVHVTTFDAARDALEARADGLVHVSADKLPTAEFVEPCQPVSRMSSVSIAAPLRR